jgi:hypothetical protein
VAYEKTEVAVAKSQEQLRKLIMAHKGFAFAAVSERANGFNNDSTNSEGFHAKVMIDGKPYSIRIMAAMKSPPKYSSDNQKVAFTQQEERRIWRVLFYHLKSVFEAADTGVMEFRELMLPYVVVGDGRTVAQHVLPRLDEYVSGNRQLTAGSE